MNRDFANARWAHGWREGPKAPLLALLAACFVACTPTLVRDLVRPPVGSEHRDVSVVVLKSGDNPVFAEPLRVFLELVDYEVTVVSMQATSTTAAVESYLAQSRPNLVVCLGTQATRAVLSAPRDVPLLFLMVPNFTATLGTPDDSVMGILLETPPASDFMQLRLVFPELTRLLAFTSAESAEFVRAAVADVQPWGIDLVPYPVQHRRDVRNALLRSPPDYDGVWLQNDSVVMNTEVFAFLRDHTRDHRKALVASLSGEFARRGALAAVAADPSAIGAQAADMARMWLDQGVPVADIGLRPPVGGKVTVNLETARAIGMTMSPGARQFVHEVIEQLPNETPPHRTSAPVE